MDRTPTDDELRFTAGDYLRKVRRVADLSQRQMAKSSKLPRSAVERIESGRLDPRVAQFQQALDLVCWSLVVVDVDGRLVVPLREFDGDLRDGADRHFPAHFDVILDPWWGEWWGDAFGLARPPETYTRDRARRDEQRARSQRDLYRGDSRRGARRGWRW